MIPEQEIQQARVWALNHFKQAYVSFPDSETMNIIPQILGKPAGVIIKYHLTIETVLMWENITVGFGNNLPNLIVNL